jgi:hypothetical protein
MVFSLEHDIKVTKNHQNFLPTQSVLVAHTVEQRTRKAISVLGQSNFFGNKLWVHFQNIVSTTATLSILVSHRCIFANLF